MSEQRAGRVTRWIWTGSALGAVAAVGVATMLGPTTGWIVFLVAMACPAVVTTVWTRWGRAHSEPSTTGDADTSPPPTLFLSTRSGPSSMTTAELCAAWEQSSVVLARLQRSGTVFAQSRVVLARQYFLDELQRRNPSGFARWLARGADAAENPSPYLCSSPPEPRSTA